ncbi:MAG: DUF3052 domain-containing protein [Bacteroidota bacterium]
MPAAGYSGTPLAKKLGIKSGFTIKVVNAPEDYFELFTTLPLDIKNVSDTTTKKDFIHYFTKSAAQLRTDIIHLKEEITQNGMIWISWPKKASKIKTDLTGNSVREIGLNAGLVDVKVCAVNEIWSGHKFVIRTKDRK